MYRTSLSVDQTTLVVVILWCITEKILDKDEKYCDEKKEEKTFLRAKSPTHIWLKKKRKQRQFLYTQSIWRKIFREIYLEQLSEDLNEPFRLENFQIWSNNLAGKRSWKREKSSSFFGVIVLR